MNSEWLRSSGPPFRLLWTYQGVSPILNLWNISQKLLNLVRSPRVIFPFLSFRAAAIGLAGVIDWSNHAGKAKPIMQFYLFLGRLWGRRSRTSPLSSSDKVFPIPTSDSDVIWLDWLIELKGLWIREGEKRQGISTYYEFFPLGLSPSLPRYVDWSSISE